MRDTGGTDHEAFDAVGLARIIHPGSQHLITARAPSFEEHGHRMSASSPKTAPSRPRRSNFVYNSYGDQTSKLLPHPNSSPSASNH
jgi:hypothetical protein